MEVSTSINTNINQAKVSNEKQQESLLATVAEKEVSALSTADTVTLSQESIDANNDEVQPLAGHGGGGVVIPPKTGG
jgi:hypothetical protein